MNAIILHDKFTEEEIGTVLLKEGVEFETVMEDWDKYQDDHNSNTENEPNIYEFVENGGWSYSDVLIIRRYYPSNIKIK